MTTLEIWLCKFEWMSLWQLKNSEINRFSKKPFCKPEYMMVVPLETLLPNWVLTTSTVLRPIIMLNGIDCHFLLIFLMLCWHGHNQEGKFFNWWQSNQILKWHWRPKFITRDSTYYCEQRISGRLEIWLI
jgi:hypothetical protein